MRKAQEYKLSSEELRKLQRIELEMLIEVDRICQKHNIRWMAVRCWAQSATKDLSHGMMILM